MNLSEEEIEKEKRICRLLCGKKNKKGKREYETFTRMQMQIDYTVDQMAEAIEIFLQYIEELEADNYEANNIINEYIEERQKLINKLKKEKLTIESTYSQINGDYFMAQDRLDLINELLEIVGGEHE